MAIQFYVFGGAVLLGLLIVVIVIAWRRPLAREDIVRRVAEGRARDLVDLREDLAVSLSAAGEERVGGLAAEIREVAARVEEIARIVAELAEREPPSSVREEIEPLLREAVEALDARLRESADARVETLGAALERILGARGFTEVEVVGDPETEDGRTRVTVAARRDGMTYKGPVLLEGAKVVEQRLVPSYPIFP